MADVAPAGVEKSLDDFFAKRDKKKKKEKGKGKEQVTGAAAAAAMPVKKMKKEKEKSTKSENQDAQMEKVMLRHSQTTHTGCVTKTNELPK